MILCFHHYVEVDQNVQGLRYGLILDKLFEVQWFPVNRENMRYIRGPLRHYLEGIPSDILYVLVIALDATALSSFLHELHHARDPGTALDNHQFALAIVDNRQGTQQTAVPSVLSL